MLRLWIRTFGKEFYKQHAGLLLIIFYALFGWMKSGDITGYLHAILVALCSTPITIAVWCLFMFLYGIKALVFVLQKLSTPVYSFVQNSCAAKKKRSVKKLDGIIPDFAVPSFINITVNSSNSYSLSLLYECPYHEHRYYFDSVGPDQGYIQKDQLRLQAIGQFFKTKNKCKKATLDLVTSLRVKKAGTDADHL